MSLKKADKINQRYSLLLLWFILLVPLVLMDIKKTSDANYMNRLEKITDGLIPDTLVFCNQRIIHISWKIKPILEKEFNRYVGQDAAWKWHFQRCIVWKKPLENILSENGLPGDLFYVCVAESKCSNVQSKAGASGFWQLIPSTAMHYGLRLDSCVDERLHPFKATRAASFYFQYLYDQLGDWAWVVVAYNAGLEKTKRWMNEQKSFRIDSILMYKESKHFLYRVLSLKYFFEHPEYFHVSLWKQTPQPSLATMRYKTLKKNIKPTYAELLSCNPWIICPDYSPKDDDLMIVFPSSYPAYFFFGIPSEKYSPDSDSSNLH